MKDKFKEKAIWRTLRKSIEPPFSFRLDEMHFKDQPQGENTHYRIRVRAGSQGRTLYAQGEPANELADAIENAAQSLKATSEDIKRGWTEPYKRTFFMDSQLEMKDRFESLDAMDMLDKKDRSRLLETILLIPDRWKLLARVNEIDLKREKRKLWEELMEGEAQ